MTLFQLTHGLNREGADYAFASAASVTHVGQAHLAGTGPAGRTCRECVRWQHCGSWSADGGPPKPSKCAKYKELMRGWGKPVPHNALACRHFDLSADPTPLTKPEKS
ncbi:UNVERIFIED_ORG: hypothetical protein M2438_002687 [Methylobacterium sp. SuP10 SLI 274]|uniref:hypothetical protein n=1 Tax=Methylorubrum extorquens TaxID=408 RepID=UPI0020A04947|nr:hypothetical protein [Methylorubrum extorquens]MDF9863919.1 hypothetical protein [Methylorubrum pseudosasae]MDH6637512.1 hypothetical protein [Methylobacterium sp. SuP10 SLI 274]MDH6666692.1 hypothetical protein [Methylorubrum zatmanii]MCP1558600.1 hypothetical protein [Methylorubrum extorquens]MDF9792229.1 hypothetical protein [Methylorubrum extorquens]